MWIIYEGAENIDANEAEIILCIHDRTVMFAYLEDGKMYFPSIGVEFSEELYNEITHYAFKPLPPQDINFTEPDFFDEWCDETFNISDVNNSDLFETELTLETLKYEYLYRAYKAGYIEAKGNRVE